MKKLIPILLLVSCSSANWAKTKAHAVEATAAGIGGAGWVLTGGIAGPFIFVGMSAIGVMVNEQMQPPDKVLVITRNEDGEITKTERFQPTDKTGNPKGLDMFSDFTYSSLKWIAVFALAIIALKIAFGPRYRELTLSFLSDLWTAFKLLGSMQPKAATLAAKSAVHSLVKASGMRHSK